MGVKQYEARMVYVKGGRNAVATIAVPLQAASLIDMHCREHGVDLERFIAMQFCAGVAGAIMMASPDRAACFATLAMEDGNELDMILDTIERGAMAHGIETNAVPKGEPQN